MLHSVRLTNSIRGRGVSEADPLGASGCEVAKRRGVGGVGHWIDDEERLSSRRSSVCNHVRRQKLNQFAAGLDRQEAAGSRLTHLAGGGYKHDVSVRVSRRSIQPKGCDIRCILSAIDDQDVVRRVRRTVCTTKHRDELIGIL